MATKTLGSVGERIDLRIRQGADFLATVELENPDGTPLDITNCVFSAQMRKRALSATVTATFVCAIVNAVGGKLSFSLTAAVTAGIAAGEQESDVASKYVWDLEMEDSLGRVMPIFFGDVTVFREVTRHAL